MSTLILKPVKTLIKDVVKAEVIKKVDNRLHQIDCIIQQIKDIKICKSNT